MPMKDDAASPEPLIDRVKEQILDFLRKQKAQVGHALNARAFQQQVYLGMTPPEQTAVNDAVKELVSEDGVLEERKGGHFLTDKGYHRIWGVESGAAGPELIHEVKEQILDFLRKQNAQVGHALNARAFQQQVYLGMTPPEQAAVNDAVKELVFEDGVLEERNGGHFLAKKGYHRIWDMESPHSDAKP